MITITIDPVIFSIGHFMIRWYSLIVLAAIVTGVWLTTREAERKGFKKDDIYDGAVWVVIGGIIGARMFHVLDHWPDMFAANPIRAFYIWEGGLAIWGGIVGGLIAVALLAWRRGWLFLRLLDTIAPGLVLSPLFDQPAVETDHADHRTRIVAVAVTDGEGLVQPFPDLGGLAALDGLQGALFQRYAPAFRACRKRCEGQAEEKKDNDGMAHGAFSVL